MLEFRRMITIPNKPYWILGICASLALVVILVVYFGGNASTVESEILPLNFPKAPEEKIADPQVSLIAVGDIMLSRVVGSKMTKYGDYRYPFLKTADLLKSADLTFGNLESPLTPGREILTGEIAFRADPEVTEGLTYAGFDVLTLANNHILNFGRQGLENTFKYLKEAEIDFIGAGETAADAYQPLIKEVQGIKFAFLAYSYTDSNSSQVALMDSAKMSEAAKQAKEQADFVIVTMHAGTEYQFVPNKHQKEFAHQAIEAGATLVIGHHPHVVETVEEYQGGYIIYSLGNFVFDQMWSQGTREGMVVKIVFKKEGITELEFHPVIIEDYSQPRFASDSEAERIIARLDLELKKETLNQIPSYKFLMPEADPPRVENLK